MSGEREIRPTRDATHCEIQLTDAISRLNRVVYIVFAARGTSAE